MIIDHRLFNPLGFHLMKLMQDETRRTIILYGGSSSGKTYSMAQTVLLFTKFEKSNTLVMRKVGASIKDTVYNDFKQAAEQLGISDQFTFREDGRLIKCENGARIVFKGCDDSEKIKGLSSFKRIILDECSEFDFADYNQLTLRLRGKKGQQIIITFNPISESHWLKKEIFDNEVWSDVSMHIDGIPDEYTAIKSYRQNQPKQLVHKRTGEITEHPSDMVALQTTYLNNFWVVGSPDGTYGYYDDHCIATFEHKRIHNPDYYNVYALGEWGIIQTGSEYFSAFNRGMHCGPIAYNPTLPIHISVDNNVLPYITITYWQIDLSDGYRIRQIGETCAEPPNNSIMASARLVGAKLRDLGVSEVYLHGDASTKAANTFDEQKRSWMDLFIDALSKEGIKVIDCVGNKNPSVSISGEFINEILSNEIEDTDIMISEECKMSIDDYMSVQKDVNGGMEKRRVKNKATGQTYEEHGHCSDTCRYVIVDLLADKFIVFSNKRKRNLYAEEGFLQYYNPETECRYSQSLMYLIPDINGRSVAAVGRLCGDRWHITSAICSALVLDTEEIATLCLDERPDCLVVECNKAYYPLVRSLRDDLPDVRVKSSGDDIGKRINATSSLVREIASFNSEKEKGDEDYARFISSLLDYKNDSEYIHASACLSGFVQFASRLATV